MKTIFNSCIVPLLLLVRVVPASAMTGTEIKVYTGNGRGKCLGYDYHGDFYLYDCTNSMEQKFRLEANRFVAEGGPKTNQCMQADRWFWPKLQPCADGEAEQQWFFSSGKIVTSGGTKCLRYDPSWTNYWRLKVEDCDNNDHDEIWVLNAAPITTGNTVIGNDLFGRVMMYSPSKYSAEQRFQLDSRKKLVAVEGALAGKCLYEHEGRRGATSMRLGTCDDNDMKQKWEYEGGKFVTDSGRECLLVNNQYGVKWLWDWSKNQYGVWSWSKKNFPRVTTCSKNDIVNRIWSWNVNPINGNPINGKIIDGPINCNGIDGKGKCVGYDYWGDLYLHDCTGGEEQNFTLDSDGRIISQGGPKRFECVVADGSFWPKLRPCADRLEDNLDQLWEYEFQKIKLHNAQKCLRFDPSWSNSRLKVETCDNDSLDAIWF